MSWGEDNPIVGTMVWCEECRSVVWAHDSDRGDLRAVCNMFRLPCPECGAVASFDGLSVTEGQRQQMALAVYTRRPIVDAWAAMHELAEDERLVWKNGPDLTWRVHWA